jgi:hypothetical protein
MLPGTKNREVSLMQTLIYDEVSRGGMHNSIQPGLFGEKPNFFLKKRVKNMTVGAYALTDSKDYSEKVGISYD